MNLYQELTQKEKKLAVIGLGYVGLPIALAFAKKISVIGFDVNAERVAQMRQGIDPSHELSAEDFADADIIFTDSPAELKMANFFIVAVPTPIDRYTIPDLTPLLRASETVGRALKKGDCVVFESTVYPGCTEEDCVPLLEQFSGLKAYTDFKVGYSPERINPGDKEHTLATIVKVVAGNDAEATEQIARTYELVVQAGVFRAASIKVAEAAKVIENTQRDLNIALMNELSHIFNRLNINTYDVLEAAGTKWNFLKFQPGLVGGHCIGVDPYYLTHKAKALGYMPEIILSGRRTNDTMGREVARNIVQRLAKLGHNLSQSRVLVLGTTFKENVADIRNSKIIDVVSELKAFGLAVDLCDPHASAAEFMHEYGEPLAANPSGRYEALVMAVVHREYLALTAQELAALAQPNCLLADLKGKFRDKAEGFHYWSL